MRYKAFVYKENDINTYVTEKSFNNSTEIIDFLDEYVGYWVRFVSLENLNIIIEGIYKPWKQDFIQKGGKYYVA